MGTESIYVIFTYGKINMKYFIYILFFLTPFLSFGITDTEMNEIVSSFCKSTDTLKRLDDYHPNVKLSEEEKTQFAFLALNQLLDDPQWLDLTYGWKVSRLEGVIANLDSDRIPLFKALRSRTSMFNGDIIFIDALERVIGNNPGYTIQYVENENLDKEERLDLITKWENLFKKNREYIVKKRQYKNKYYGKRVAK